MIKDDEYLERMVAAIHAKTTGSAEVKWNEVINNRQFDVVIRFRVGTLRYLVLIEVKNRTRKASVEDVDAFVTKSRDQLANKAVFVTAAGFQSGAIEVARRHGIECFTVTFDMDAAEAPEMSFASFGPNSPNGPSFGQPDVTLGEPTLIANVDKFTLIYADGRRRELPSEPSQAAYYSYRSVLSDGRSLNDLVQGMAFNDIALGETRADRVDLSPPLSIRPPDEEFFPAGRLAAVEANAVGRMGRGIVGNSLIEPGFIRPQVVYTNVSTGDVDRFRLDQLPLGVGLAEAGKFYFTTEPLMYYYVERVDAELMTLHLVESFQNLQKVSATFTQKHSLSTHFIPVKDTKTLARMKRRLAEYTRRRAGNPLTAAISQPSASPGRPKPGKRIKGIGR
jgi:hypothetical protein